MIRTLKTDDLQAVVNDNPIVVVQFMAVWCGQCGLIQPEFKNLAKAHPDIEFVLVDAEKFPESRKMARVDNLPTFAAFKNGKFVDQIQVDKPKSLQKLVDRVTKK